MSLPESKETTYRIGFKVNANVITETFTLDCIVSKLLKKISDYVIGYDSTYCTTPHYHIHWVDTRSQQTVASTKSQWFKKLHEQGIDTGGNSTQLYSGNKSSAEEVEKWYGYSIKESCYFSSIELTDKVLTYAKTCLSNKRFNWEKKSKDLKKEADKRSFEDKLTAHLRDTLKSGNSVPLSKAIIEFYRSNPEQRRPNRNKLQQHVLDYMYSESSYSADDIYQYTMHGFYSK